jgi:hypothetical protein
MPDEELTKAAEWCWNRFVSLRARFLTSTK